MATTEHLFRRLTAGDTYNRTLSIYQQRYDLFLTIAAVVLGPIVVALVLTTVFFAANMEKLNDAASSMQNQQDPYDSDIPDIPQGFFAFGGFILFEVGLYFVLVIVGQAAMTRAVAEMYVGRTPNWKDCLKEGFKSFCPIICTSLLAGLAFLIAYFIAFIAMGIVIGIGDALFGDTVAGLAAVLGGSAIAVAYVYFFVALMTLTPTIVVEKKGPVDAIYRCWELANNNRCYIFCTAFGLALALVAVQLVLSLIFANSVLGVIVRNGFSLFTLPLATM